MNDFHVETYREINCFACYQRFTVVERGPETLVQKCKCGAEYRWVYDAKADWWHWERVT